MKKSLVMLLSLLLVLTSFNPVFAATWVAPEMNVNATYSNGEVTVTVDVGENDLVAGIGFYLNYDKTKVSFNSYEGKGFLKKTGSNLTVGTDTAGVIKVTSAREDAIQCDKETIFEVKFNAINSGNAEFSLSNFEINDGGDNEADTTAGTHTAAVTIPNAPLTAVTASVAQPVKGTALDTTVDIGTATAYTATVEWYEGNSATGTAVNGKAKAETVYTAKITLTAKTGESFADSLNNTTTTDGYTIKKDSDTKLTLTKTFDKTDDKAALTGKPTITGIGTDNIPRIGDTLTANVTALNDSVNISYQWFAGDTAIDGAQSATYTLTAAEKDKTIKVKITANNASEYKGTVESDATATVQKKKCTMVATEPTLSATDVTVTVTNVTEGHEYAIAENNTAAPTSGWQTSGTFFGLQPNKTYYVYSRVAENDTTLAGEVKIASVKTSKSTASAPTAPSVSAKTDTTITVTKVGGQKYMIKQSTEAAPTATDTGWLDESNFTGLTGNTAYKIYTYIPENETCFASAVVSEEVTTEKTSVNNTLIPVSGLEDKAYNAAEQEPTFGDTLTRGTDYTVTYAPASKGSLSDAGKPIGAGTYTVKIAGTGNYTGYFTEEFVIAPKNVIVTPDSGISKKYGETDPEFTYTVDLAAGDLKTKFDAAKSGKLARKIGETVGEYNILIGDLAAGDNFVLALSTTPVVFTITKADQTITVPTDKQITKNGIEVDIKDWASTNASADGAALTYTLDGTYEGVSLSDDAKLKVESTATVAKISIKVNSAATKSYSAAAEKTMTVTVVDKLSANVTITNAPTSKTYGDANFKIKASVGAGVTGGTWSWSTDATGTFEIVEGGNTDEVTLKVLKANTGGATLTATYTSDTHYDTQTTTINVEQKEVTVEEGTYKVSKVYDGTTNVGTASGDLTVSGILPADTGVSVKATPVEYTDANVGGQTTMNVAIALDGTGKDNYKIKGDATTVTVPCEITKATLTASGTASANAAYGTKVKNIEISGLTAMLNGTAVAGTWSFNSEDTPDVGTTTAYKASFTPTTGAGNYNELTKDIVPTINALNYAGETNASGKAKYGTSGTVDLSGYIVEGGTATFDSSIDNDGVLNGTPSVNGKTLNFKFNDSAEVGKTAKIKVNVTSGNYKGYTVEVTVTVLDKSSQNIEASDINAKYGDTVKLNSTGTHGKVSYAVTKGADVISVDESGNITTNKAGTAEITITAAGDETYAIGTKVVQVNIAKRLITVKANDKTMTVNGTLPSFDVTYGNFAAADTKGTVIGTEAVAGVAAEVDGKTVGSFDITITTAPTLKAGMDDKYDFEEAKKGTLKVNAAFSGGGGGFAAPTVQKPEIVIDETQGKAELSNNGTTANITANEGYEIEKVTVNGVDKGAVNKLTGLKTGDKVVVTFKSTAPTADDKDAVVKQLTSKVSKLQIVARSVKTNKKNVKVTLKTDEQTNAAIKEIKSLGYTVKYKFYRSTKKAKGYKAVLTKTSKTYTNTKGVKGTMYYYKARVQVYDKDGKLVAQTALKQCKYANRLWTK